MRARQTIGSVADAVGKCLIAGLRRHGRDDPLEHARGETSRARALVRPGPGDGQDARHQEIRGLRRPGPLNDLSHWGYGTGWACCADCSARPECLPRRRRRRTARHLPGGPGDLPALEIAPPSVFWAREEIAIDAFHHAVYAAATGIAYELIDNGR